MKYGLRFPTACSYALQNSLKGCVRGRLDHVGVF